MEDRLNQTGFIAQEFMTEFPELVKLDKESGLYKINYIGLTPVIVESIKDQDKLLNQQSIKITDLESRITNLEKIINIDAKKSSTETIDNLNQDDTPFLSQNIPNPFDQQTDIAYYLTESSLNAMINIYNMNGNPIKSINIANSGKGIITIKGSELQAGMYLYSLIADGVEIDTKRMILTE